MTEISVIVRDHSDLDGRAALPVGDLTLWSVDNLLIARTGWQAIVESISLGVRQNSVLTDSNVADTAGEGATDKNAIRSNKMVFKWRDTVNPAVKGRISIPASTNDYEIQGTKDVDKGAALVVAAIAFIEATAVSVLGNSVTVYDVIMSS